MTKAYDVIIIGAGPSGTSCALNLKRFNPDVRILLLDKAEFPRYKPCGGGVSPEVSNYFDFDLSAGIDSICDDIVMVANKRQVACNKYPLWMVRREKFDDFLLQQAKDRGVEFQSAVTVTNVIGHSVVTSAGEYTAQVVVIAEGGRGGLAKKLGLSKKNTTLLAAMEYEHYTPDGDGKLYIDFDYNVTGYAWNFPKSDGLSLGIGGFIKGQAKGNVALPNKLRSYSQQFAVEHLNKAHLHGHPIQLYSGRQQLVHQHIVLIGEIAGCVDPLTAEGIRPAIKSGYLAAKAIAQALGAKQLKLLISYDKTFHAEIGRDFAYARIMAYFLNRNMAKVLPLISTKTAVEGFMTVFSGNSSYRQKINWRRIIKLAWRTLRH